MTAAYRRLPDRARAGPPHERRRRRPDVTHRVVSRSNSWSRPAGPWGRRRLKCTKRTMTSRSGGAGAWGGL